jgi:hypothetical protein
LAHQQFFGNIGHAPNRTTSLDPHLQNKNQCAPLDFSLYTGELNFVQTIWDKTEKLWEHLEERIWELDNPSET